MTRDDHDAPHREELAPFARAAASTIESQTAPVQPDFAAMMARARKLPADDSPIAPVIPLVKAGADDDKLAAFTGALTAEIDAGLRDLALSRPPVESPLVPPAVPPAVGRGRTRAVVLGVLAAGAAAVLVAAFGLELARRVGGADQGVEANAEQIPDSKGDAAYHVPAPGPAERAAVPAQPGELVPGPATDVEGPEPVSPGTAAPEDSSEGRARDTEPPRRRADPTQKRPPKPRDDQPERPTLEEEAQALWQRGELAAAEQKFREVLHVAGHGRRAELAYGDLFTLARQMRGSDGQMEVWREYLARFPRGRFAEDARAGLCQRATEDARAACWREYLEYHPSGAHRALAEAARDPGDGR